MEEQKEVKESGENNLAENEFDAEDEGYAPVPLYNENEDDEWNFQGGEKDGESENWGDFVGFQKNANEDFGEFQGADDDEFEEMPLSSAPYGQLLEDEEGEREGMLDKKQVSDGYDLTEEKVEEIKLIMSNIKLNNVPNWAKDVGEQRWLDPFLSGMKERQERRPLFDLEDECKVREQNKEEETKENQERDADDKGKEEMN